MDIKIPFEDDQLIVIDKPAGVTVNRADTVGEGTVQDWIEQRKKEEGRRKKELDAPPFAFCLLPSSFVSRSGIVHRLDKDTSGCLIIAKTPAAFAELQRQFKSREVKKEYLALVHGKVEPSAGAIRVPLSRSRFDRQKFTVSAAGRPAETAYKVSKLYSEFTLLCLFPVTGRTHQIRVHLKYFGHPIVADEKYGGKRAAADRLWCPRLFLHAAKITFTHPLNKHEITVESPFPEDLEKSLSKLSAGTA